MILTGTDQKPQTNGSDISHVQEAQYHTGTTRRTMSAEIMPTAAQLYGKSHLEKLAVGE